jgi:hypothetical protein
MDKQDETAGHTSQLEELANKYEKIFEKIDDEHDKLWGVIVELQDRIEKLDSNREGL